MKLGKKIRQLKVIRLMVLGIKEIHFTKYKISLYAFLVILYGQIKKDHLIERARAMGFSFLLSIFPAIIFLFTLIPYIPIAHLDVHILASLKDLMPVSIYETIEHTIVEILQRPHGGLMSFGFLFAIYSATNGIMAMTNAFNKIYHTSDRRSFLQKLWRSVVIIFLLSLVMFIAIGLTVLLEIYMYKLPIDQRAQQWGLVLLKYFIIFMVFYLGLSLVYFIAPAIKKRFAFFSYGSFIATVLILLFTWGFSNYVNNFNSYNKVYGSIGALIGLMLWLYAVSLVILIGFEINTSIALTKDKHFRDKLEQIEKNA